jgi:hypothetical protein
MTIPEECLCSYEITKSGMGIRIAVINDDCPIHGTIPGIPKAYPIHAKKEEQIPFTKEQFDYLLNELAKICSTVNDLYLKLKRDKDKLDK